GIHQKLGTAGVFDYYPALAPDSSGKMTMVFGQSGAAEYPRVDYVGITPPTGHSSACPCLEGIGLLKSGTRPYVHSSEYQHSITVGDYFTAAIDPDFLHVWIRGNLGPTRSGTDWTSVIGETKP